MLKSILLQKDSIKSNYFQLGNLQILEKIDVCIFVCLFLKWRVLNLALIQFYKKCHVGLTELNISALVLPSGFTFLEPYFSSNKVIFIWVWTNAWTHPDLKKSIFSFWADT